MVVAEILTGIALVKKSVDFIKENISTVQDIQGIAKQIDGFFLGEEQMNKGQGKGMSIMEQFGSVESSATDYIDRKLLEEKRQELKNLINLRFGPQAWDQIIAERADRINQAREAQRQARMQAKKRQDELLETVKWVGIVFICIGVLVVGLVVGVKVFAKGNTYQSKNTQFKGLTKQQQLNQGLIKNPTMTLCRLMKQKVYKDKMACIYRGAQKTYEMEFTDIRVGCPKSYRCVLNPNGKEPSISDVMDSLRSIKGD
jgi:preprotein translocase subunit Sss1